MRRNNSHSMVSRIRQLLQQIQPWHKTKNNEYRLIYELIEEQVEKTPNAIAVELKGSYLTYRELNSRSNQLAWKIRKMGVQPNDIVCIMVKRSLQMFVALLGVLKAGAAFLPVDPDFPEERIVYMVEDSNAKVIISDAEMEYRFLSFKDKVICVDEPDIYDHDTSNLNKVAKASDLAYVIYTSGSTGKPKGVMIEHKSVVNLLYGISDRIPLSEHNVILALTTISFDIFILETLIPLALGLRVAIADENDQKNPKSLCNLIMKSSADILQITPSRLQMLINHNKNLECLKNLKVVMIGGEPLSEVLLEQVKGYTNARIFNMYGPTETTVWSTVADLTQRNSVDIGMPIRNTQIYIINENSKPVTGGAEGELCIGGDGLSRGYLNRPELTAQKFITDLSAFHEKIYRTGDLARWLENGNIECLGRIDNQVKIRGYRIELEEIENCILKFGAVKQAVVTAIDGKESIKYLCAYFVSDDEISVSDLREHLVKSLPNYMLPAYFIRIDSIPQTLNGKIDRKALPPPGLISEQSNQKNHQNAETLKSEDIELKIKEMIRDTVDGITAIEQIDVNNQLTEVGINSITYIKIVVLIEGQFNFEFGEAELNNGRFSIIKELIDYVESMIKN
ncbi:non-ribosomal peptide synthetase [Ruminiclostridium papyrosolvens]|uniref:Carrier domain-containing protein n=1 Tax=Ruminiclostridium papyrosolvens C7 TaxID=1330534 RepID=U4R116_9FIRM|nr:non-ribosomal peptide synthetase [Ruminiclostridium papyrosolvens]EPR10458.1 hypothetical protein L323_12460 [Ruminiclostridium papyrosolvens C7]